MATQSLYRRYRPRRFSELKGQDHIVRALREAVRTGREGQAYLFSGPRGTGKTSSARILAKVLNCESPEDGEPCCACASCLAVEHGTSYDVHELDAASNNGVDAIRDLVEKASLGTPGRHKVYILDEAHMLSKAASAALLKTLEEPPSHVVFVLATTDPQKISDTIRSRTQHLQFHLLPADTLSDHVRWVAEDAGLNLSAEALDSVVTQGAGSARDTLSALELMAATGGEVSDRLDLDPILRALIDAEPGVALTAVAEAIRAGYEPRSIAESLVGHLRDCFLALMAPDLVMLPRQRVDQIAEVAQELGVAAIVRAIERLGTVLIEMRHAPDPRVLLEVALVHLTHAHSGQDLEVLMTRLEKLEHAVRSGVASAPGATAPRGAQAGAEAPAPAATPVNPASGRAVVGGRARADTTGATTRPRRDTTATDAPAPGAAPAASRPSAPPAASTPTAAAPVGGNPDTIWEQQVRPQLKPFVRALYSAGTFTRHDPNGEWTFSVPNTQHADKCEEHRAHVEAALSAAWGAPVRIVLTVGGSQRGGRDSTGQIPRPASDHIPEDPAGSAASPVGRDTGRGTDVDADLDIDLDELVDAPPESVVSPVERLAQAFPGAELIDDPDRI